MPRLPAGRRALLIAAISAIGYGLVISACETISRTEINAYTTALATLRRTTADQDASLGSQFNALIDSGSRESSAYINIYRKLRESNAALVEELEKITPPAGVRRHHRDFINGLKDLVTALDRVMTMIQAGHVRNANLEFQRAVTRSQAQQTGAMLQIRRVARSVGAQI